MEMKTLRDTARLRMKGFCSLCQVCDGKACAGKMPGMGGSITGSSFNANSRALSDVRLNMRVVHDCNDPDTHFNFFGSSLSTPIMNGPMASPNNNCGPIDDLEFEVSLLKGTTQAGGLGWVGDPAQEEFFMNGCKAIAEVGAGVVISKPHYDSENVRLRFQWGKDAGAVAFGMDLDGAGILQLKKLGYPVGPKTIEELKEIRSFMPSSPFIIKGIMTSDDALRCRDAGVDCIVVSNHGGRVLDGTPGVAEVLPEIAKAVGEDIVILADGAVRSGVDILKYLALGAKGVLVGRPLCWGVYGGGAEGVKLIIDTYTEQLKQAMILTGCRSLADIDSRILYGV